MLISTVNLSNGSRVFLIDQWLTADALKELRSICHTYSQNNDNWKSADWSDLRWYYHGSLENIIKEISTAKSINDAVGKSLIFANASLWIDLPGPGGMTPHVEGDGSYLAQIYISDKEWPDCGTTIYNDQKQILFQLPFRDNFGWLFEYGTTVMHGREHDVPDGLNRFSLMIWYTVN